MLHRIRLDIDQLAVEGFETAFVPDGFLAAVEPDPNQTMNVNQTECCVTYSCLSFVVRHC